MMSGQLIAAGRRDERAAPWARAVVAQLIGVVAATGCAAIWSGIAGKGLDATAWIAIEAAAAAGAAHVLGLPRWWMWLSLWLFPGLALGMWMQVGPVLPASVLGVLLLAYGGTQSTRVPLYLSSRGAIGALQAFVAEVRPRRILDIGCGNGRVLHALAAMPEAVQRDGIERAPLPFFIAWLRGRMSERRFRVRCGDFWSRDLSGYDLVYAYLSPVPMPALWEKARREMRAGSWLVSFRFPVPGVRPQAVRSAGGQPLFVYRLP